MRIRGRNESDRDRMRQSGSLFFSSRRRHTRYWRDWSSDVCSSDLRAVVAIVPDGGLTQLFADEGATVVPCGPDGVREDDVLAAVLASGAAGVVVLPNDPTLTALASRAAERAREEGRDVAVVPTRSPDRKSTRLNSSHANISYAVFCLK